MRWVHFVHNKINCMLGKDEISLYASICASGCLYRSTDYGVNFVLQTFNFDNVAVSMSSTGQYQAMASNSSASKVAHKSNNFGLSWTAVTLTVTDIITICSVSSTGKYMFVYAQGDLIISNNFGVSFASSNGT
jgi:hypothetical protein